MAVDSVRAPLRLPARNFNHVSVPKIPQRARTWFRVHQSRFSALHFSLNTIHRFSHEESPCAFLYLAEDVQTCLFECFGDKTYDEQRIIPQSLWTANCVTGVRVPEVHLCDLTDPKTNRILGLDVGALMKNDLTVPQSWGLAIQRHPARFHGLKFKSRFNGRTCLALFERDRVERRLKEISFGTLLQNKSAAGWLEEHQVSLF